MLQMSSLKRLLLPLVVLMPSVATAEYESRTLLSKGAWSVEVTFNTVEQNFWCAAQTSNNQNQLFGITAYESGGIAVFFFDDRWDLAERTIDFLIDIDYDRWTITGKAHGIGISTDLSDSEFVDDLVRGNAVALLNADERRLATFSLNGSAAAMAELMKCWDNILIDSDPFQTSQDPF